jgi:hypothetical protein
VASWLDLKIVRLVHHRIHRRCEAAHCSCLIVRAGLLLYKTLED